MKVLYNTETSQLSAYPRLDDEPVVGLDPKYLALTVITDTVPTFDPTTEFLTETQTIDTNALTVTNGWIVSSRNRQLGWITVEEFMDCFTLEEKAAVSLSTNPTIAGLRLTLTTWLSRVLLSDPRVDMGLTALVSEGLISSARRTEVESLAYYV